MKNKLLILVVGILIGLMILLSLNLSKKEDYFNQVELSNNNNIVNSLRTTYYDTILSVGLDQSNLNGITVVMSELSSVAKNQFNGDLKAHIRFYDGIYYLFIDEYSRNESIDIISHEIIHIIQYNSNQLKYDNDIITWESQPFGLDDIEYDNRPWEKDAFQRGPFLSNKIQQILYE